MKLANCIQTIIYFFFISIIISCDVKLKNNDILSSVIVGYNAASEAEYQAIFYSDKNSNLKEDKIIDFTGLVFPRLIPNFLLNDPKMGIRTNESTPVPFNLFFRKLNRNQAYDSGDFYFETPILSSEYEIGSVTTALSVFLKYSFPRDFLLSRNSWKSILQKIEFECTECNELKAYEVLNKINNQQRIRESILAEVQKGNPSVSQINWNPPESILIWTSQDLDKTKSNNQSLTLRLKENDLLNLWIATTKTNQLGQLNLNYHWKVSKLNESRAFVQIETRENLSSYKKQLSFNESGTYQFIVSSSDVENSSSVQFNVIVQNINQNPYWIDSIQDKYTCTANKVCFIPLTAFAKDNDLESLTFQFANPVFRPKGAFISNGSNAGFRWIPPQPSNEQIENILAGTLDLTQIVEIEVTDTNGASQSHRLTIQIKPDRLPTFGMSTGSDLNKIYDNDCTSILTSIEANEGQAITILIKTVDLDYDSTALNVVPNQKLMTSLPNGSGIRVEKCNDDICVPACNRVQPNPEGNQYQVHFFKMTFIPSYMQTLYQPSSFINFNLYKHIFITNYYYVLI